MHMDMLPIQAALKTALQNGPNLPEKQPRPELSKLENTFLESLKSPKLKDCSTDVITGILSIGLLKLGLKAANVDPLLLSAAVDELFTAHGNLTVKELKLAFDMATRMQLDFNPQTYQNFSILYLNQLVASYKEWAAQTHRMTVKEMPEDKPKKVFQDLTKDHFRGQIEQGLQNVRNGILYSPLLIPYDWYSVMVEDGYLSSVFILPENKYLHELTPDETNVLKSAQQYIWDFFTNYKEDNLYIPA